jgi:hypothetical protein
MEPESRYDDVITRFLLNEAGAEEEKFVLDWINADEKNRLYVESLRRTIQLFDRKQDIEKINVDEEWKQFRQRTAGGMKMVALPAVDQRTGWDDQHEEKQSGRARMYKIILATSVAASVVFLIGLRAGWFSQNVKQGTIAVQQKKTSEDRAKIDPLMTVVQREVNTSGKIRPLVLPDGSEIVLSDSSELTYKEPSNGSRRDVYLVGKADFKVAKNKAKPFTVFSDEISTTAVGTRFTVTAKQKEQIIRVRLFEGKVVIKPVNGYHAKWAKDIYLIPGQELLYDKVQKTVKVISFTDEKPSDANNAEQLADNPTIPHFDKRSWFMFNNQSLSEIFDALSDMYDVKIVYAKKDVKNMYFIGTYEKSDSLEKILKQIALLNNLKVTKQNDTFKIEKQTINK